MDEKRSGMSLKAQGASGGSMRLPGRGPSPAVDDHLVAPEVTRDEIIAGRKVVAFPAEAPHGDKQVDLDTLLRLHVAPGYVVSADLITRVAVDRTSPAIPACGGKGSIWRPAGVIWRRSPSRWSRPRASGMRRRRPR